MPGVAVNFLFQNGSDNFPRRHMIQRLARTLLLLIAISLTLAQAGLAQDQSGQNTDILRSKIELLEKTDIKSKSDRVQQIYKLTLLRLYSQLNGALQQEITDLKNIQAAASGTDADPKGEIAAQLKQLATEREVVAEKIQTLTGEARSAATAEVVVPNSAPTDAGAQADSVSLPTSGAASQRARSVVSSHTDGATPMTATGTSSGAEADSSSGGAKPKGNHASDSSQSGTETPAQPADPTKKTVTVCGQIRPASLTQTFALIRSASKGLSDTQALALTDAVKKSRLDQGDTDDECNLNKSLKNGSQKDAVVATLQKLLQELNSGKKVTKNLGPEMDSLSQETIKKQILLLNEYIGNVTVRIEDENGNLVQTGRTDNDGNYRIGFSFDEGKKYYISTEADSGQTRREIVFAAESGASARVNIPVEDRPVSLLSRAVVGYEQAGASAAKKDRNYFFDLFVSSSFPFKQKINPDFGERFRTWVDFRFASVPQPGTATIGDLASSGLATQISGLQVKDVANVFDFLAGFEYRFAGNNALLPSFDRRTKQKFSLSLIAGGGIITPTNPLDSISTFKVFADAPGLPPAAQGKEFVAFVQSDRDRFFRQYYAGLRIQTFFFNLFNMPMQRFPAQLDLTVGQNEYVTGGKLHGPVIRIEGYYPLPYEDLKFINIFGTAMLRPGHASTGIPLVLEPAPAGTVVPGANVALVALPQASRDYYRAGVGLDFISFVKKLQDTFSKK
ncbi:MAG: hypothetical protein QOD00_205 [Blastocatellia bacterium]|nr:hypothetical protein [Blastocatellia bacterium]